jgi:hypothetical protein
MEEKKIRKVALVGTAPSSVADAPYDDNSWEIWSLGSNAGKVRRFTRWFELHTVDVLDSARCIDKNRQDFLNKIGKDLFIGHESEVFPNASLYPKDEIVKTFGNYFTSSIAWMIALALYEGVDEIGLWGIDMVGDCEYSYQRACCEYYLGIARGKGITVTISPHSPLLRAERLYAFEHTGLAGEIQSRIIEANDKSAKLDEAYLRVIEERGFAKGTLHTLHDLERRWG